MPKIVIPGNHDWGLIPKDYNARSIANQQEFVDGWAAGNAEFIPKNGCMGPTVRVLSEGDEGAGDVVLIAFDPTPWIMPRIREACPGVDTTDDADRVAYLEALDAALTRHADDRVIAASHYPMLTGGGGEPTKNRELFNSRLAWNW